MDAGAGVGLKKDTSYMGVSFLFFNKKHLFVTIDGIITLGSASILCYNNCGC